MRYEIPDVISIYIYIEDVASYFFQAPFSVSYPVFLSRGFGRNCYSIVRTGTLRIKGMPL